jgi:hypothetical protein
MSNTYYNCTNLSGAPAYGNNVINMTNAYYNCRYLTGSAICGENTQYLTNTFYNCKNIGANAYFYSNKIINIKGCFANKNNSRRLNIYYPANSVTHNTLHNYILTNSSIVNANITWTNMTTYSYNKTYNIYLYPVENVASTKLANKD